MRTSPRNSVAPAASLLALTVLAVGAVCATPARAASDAEVKGLAIAREIDRRDQGFGDSEVRLDMKLTTATAIRARGGCASRPWKSRPTTGATNPSASSIIRAM